jgi:hypothetical protein
MFLFIRRVYQFYDDEVRQAYDNLSRGLRNHGIPSGCDPAKEMILSRFCEGNIDSEEPEETEEVADLQAAGAGPEQGGAIPDDDEGRLARGEQEGGQGVVEERPGGDQQEEGLGAITGFGKETAAGRGLPIPAIPIEAPRPVVERGGKWRKPDVVDLQLGYQYR